MPARGDGNLYEDLDRVDEVAIASLAPAGNYRVFLLLADIPICHKSAGEVVALREVVDELQLLSATYQSVNS